MGFLAFAGGPGTARTLPRAAARLPGSSPAVRRGGQKTPRVLPVPLFPRPRLLGILHTVCRRPEGRVPRRECMAAQAFAEFLNRIRAGDESAAAELVRQYEPLLRREVRMRLT